MDGRNGDARNRGASLRGRARTERAAVRTVGIGLEVYGGGTALVAETGFLPGDAHQFASLAEAQAEADWLKGRGIGGADWTAEEVRP